MQGTDEFIGGDSRLKNKDKLFISAINILLLYIMIGALWIIAEKLIYGQITPRVIDDIVALILATSLHINIKNYMGGYENG